MHAPHTARQYASHNNRTGVLELTRVAPDADPWTYSELNTTNRLGVEHIWVESRGFSAGRSERIAIAEGRVT